MTLTSPISRWKNFGGSAQAIQSRDGHIWDATLNGLARFDGRRFTNFDLTKVAGLRPNEVYRILEDRSAAANIAAERRKVGMNVCPSEPGKHRIFNHFWSVFQL